MSKRNVFEVFLDCMSVKYTNVYSDYKVENVSIRLKNKRQGLDKLDIVV